IRIDESVFTSVISNLGLYQILNSIKKDMNVGWKETYLLFYKLIKQNFGKDTVSTIETKHARNDAEYRYITKIKYPEVYNYLIQFEKFKLETLDPQFYLTNQRGGFDWLDIYNKVNKGTFYHMEHMIRDLINDYELGDKIDVLKLIKLFKDI